MALGSWRKRRNYGRRYGTRTCYVRAALARYLRNMCVCVCVNYRRVIISPPFLPPL